MTPEEIMADFAGRDDFPHDALAAAGKCRESLMPLFLDQIERLQSKELGSFAGADVSSFLFIYFLLGEWRDARAYRPLAALLRRDSDVVDALIGDAVTEGTARVIAGVCDGDLEPIFSVIADSAADEFIRSQMLDALVIIFHHRPELQQQVVSYFENFPAADFDKPELLWASWVSVVAALGLAHLEPQVKLAFEQKSISPLEMDFDFFQEELRLAVEGGEGLWYYDSRATTLIESAIDELSSLYSSSDKFIEDLFPSKALDDLGSNYFGDNFFGDTFERETPKVGRNDPCPCGSGKKFKKCCLS